MDNKRILIAILILLVAQVLTWFQMFGQLKWKMLQNIYLICLTGVPITWMYWYAIKVGHEQFGETWPMRLFQFVCGIIIFTIMTSIFLGEGLNLKNSVSLALCFLIILLQVFWK